MEQRQQSSDLVPGPAPSHQDVYRAASTCVLVHHILSQPVFMELGSQRGAGTSTGAEWGGAVDRHTQEDVMAHEPSVCSRPQLQDDGEDSERPDEGGHRQTSPPCTLNKGWHSLSLQSLKERIGEASQDWLTCRAQCKVKIRGPLLKKYEFQDSDSRPLNQAQALLRTGPGGCTDDMPMKLACCHSTSPLHSQSQTMPDPHNLVQTPPEYTRKLRAQEMK